MAFWPTSDLAAPIAVAERFLLVEDEKTVPFDRLRLISSRDYRRPPEICAVVEPDGVTMVLDPARSDLLVEAELARFADLVPAPQPERETSRGAGAAAVSRSRAASLRRGMNRGMSAAQLVEWYARRTGAEMPPAGAALARGEIITRSPAQGGPHAGAQPAHARAAGRLASASRHRPLSRPAAWADARLVIADDQLPGLQKP